MPVTETALADAHSYNFSLLASISQADIHADTTLPRGFIPGGISFLNSAYGPRIVQYVQNRTTAVVQGALLSSIGDVNAITPVTSSGAAAVNTKTLITTSGLTANRHIGGGVLIQNSTIGAGVAPEGEESICVGNTTTTVNVDPNLPFSVTTTSGDTINLIGFYNARAAADGDLALTVLGVVVGKNGITADNFGWVCKQGKCPNALIKASTALVINDALVADTGRLGPSTGSTDASNLYVGAACSAMQSDIVTDKTSVVMMLGFGVTMGTADVSL